MVGSFLRRRADPGDAAPPSAGLRDLGWATGLGLLAWVVRLLFLESNGDRDLRSSILYHGDAEHFLAHADALLAGQLYESGIPFHPPGFPYFLAGLFRLLGAGEVADVSPVALKRVLAAIAALGVGLLYVVVRPYLGRTVALVAALLATFHFGLEVIAVAPVNEATYLTLLLATLVLWSRGLRHPLSVAEGVPRREPWTGLVVGLAFGALALLRAEALLVGCLLLGVGLVGCWLRPEPGAPRFSRRRLLPWILVAVGGIAALTPNTLHNARVLGEFNARKEGQLGEPLPTFVPLTLYGPLNLALANNAEADGTFSRAFIASRVTEGALTLENPEHLEVLLHGDRHAREFIFENPKSFAGLVLKKWALFSRVWTLGLTQWDWPGGLVGTRRPVDMFTPTSTAAAWIWVPLVLLGLVLCWRTPGDPRRWAVLVTLLAAAALFTTALFFGYVRQGLLLVPFGLTLAAYAGVWLARRGWRDAESVLRDPSRRALALLGLAVLVLGYTEVRGARERRNFRLTGVVLPGRDAPSPDLALEIEAVPVGARGRGGR